MTQKTDAQKKCIRCPALFTPKRRHARFCGPKCASAERSKRYRARHSADLPLVATPSGCAICGKSILVLTGAGGSSRRYCSEDCKKTAEKLREPSEKSVTEKRDGSGSE